MTLPIPVTTCDPEQRSGLAPDLDIARDSSLEASDRDAPFSDGSVQPTRNLSRAVASLQRQYMTLQRDRNCRSEEADLLVIAVGHLPKLQHEIYELEHRLEEIAAAIKAVDGAWRPDGTWPKRRYTDRSPFQRGVARQHAMKMLREAPGGHTISEIAADLLSREGCGAIDLSVFATVAASIRAALVMAETEGKVKAVGKPKRWSLAQ